MRCITTHQTDLGPVEVEYDKYVESEFVLPEITISSVKLGGIEIVSAIPADLLDAMEDEIADPCVRPPRGWDAKLESIGRTIDSALATISRVEKSYSGEKA